jgi:hypothetical protein
MEEAMKEKRRATSRKPPVEMRLNRIERRLERLDDDMDVLGELLKPLKTWQDTDAPGAALVGRKTC